VSTLVIESEERISFLREVSVAAKRVLVLEYDGIPPRHAQNTIELVFLSVPGNHKVISVILKERGLNGEPT